MKALCAIDGSESSDAAVSLVGQLLSPNNGEVLLYYSPPKVSVAGPLAESAEVLDQVSHTLVERVFERAREMLPRALRKSVSTLEGQQRPRLGIPAAAKMHHVDLIAVGARGTRPFGLPRLGSVSRAVIHSTDLPVLVARSRIRPATEPLQIVYCCDRVEVCGATSVFLNDLCFAEDTVGRVVHVAESVFTQGLPEWLEAEARICESDPTAKAYLEEHDAELESSRTQTVEHCQTLPKAFHTMSPVILEGHPGEQIARFIEAEAIDLVIVGARTQSTLARMLGGSTSEHVLAHAGCSVLIVPNLEDP